MKRAACAGRRTVDPRATARSGHRRVALRANRSCRRATLRTLTKENQRCIDSLGRCRSTDQGASHAPSKPSPSDRLPGRGAYADLPAPRHGARRRAERGPDRDGGRCGHIAAHRQHRDHAGSPRRANTHPTERRARRGHLRRPALGPVSQRDARGLRAIDRPRQTDPCAQVLHRVGACRRARWPCAPAAVATAAAARHPHL